MIIGRKMLFVGSLCTIGLSAPVAFSPTKGLTMNQACASDGSMPTYYCCQLAGPKCPATGSGIKLIDFYEVEHLSECGPGGGEEYCDDCDPCPPEGCGEVSAS